MGRRLGHAALLLTESNRIVFVAIRTLHALI